MNILGMEEKDAAKYVNNVLAHQERQAVNTKPIRDMGLMKKYNHILEPFIGTHELEMVALPTWFKDLKRKWAEDVIVNIKAEIAEQVHEEIAAKKATLKETQLILDLHEQMRTITVENFKAGIFPNGRKILKYMVSVAEQIKGKENYEQSEWFKFFVKSNVSGGKTYITITPSIASHLAMSNVFDKDGMSSCQGFNGYSDGRRIPDAIWGNIMSEDSLLVYVTVGRRKAINGTVLEHDSMIARTYMRLMTDSKMRCKKCKATEFDRFSDCCFAEENKEVIPGQMYITFDRFYTQDTYFRDVFLCVKNIADKLDIKMAMYENYNKSKDGGTTNYKVNLGKTMSAYLPSGIKALNTSGMDCSICSRKDMGTCEKFEKCKYFKVCESKQCESCLLLGNCVNIHTYYPDNNMNTTKTPLRIGALALTSKLRLVDKIE